MVALVGALLLSIGLGSVSAPPALPAPALPSSFAASVEAPGSTAGAFAADPHLAVSYFGARYYGSKIGRFTTVDPAMDLRASLVNPQKWNRYAYGLNNPLRYIDPDGRQEAHGAIWAERRNIENTFGPVGVADWQRRNTQAAGTAVAGVGVVGAGLVAGTYAPALAMELRIALGLAGPAVGQMVAGNYGQVSRSELEAAAKAGGPVINVLTRQTSAPEAGRALSVAAGEGAEALANAARSSGTLYGAAIPRALMSTMERAGLVQVSTTAMKGGTQATEYRFLPQATEFVTKMFEKK